MIKLEKIFPEVQTDVHTLTRIADDMTPGILVHSTYKKGFSTQPSYHKTAKEIFYILKGEIEFYVHEISSGRKFDFRATDGMLVTISPNTSVYIKVLKDSSCLNGTSVTGRDDANTLDFEFEEKLLTPTST